MCGKLKLLIMHLSRKLRHIDRVVADTLEIIDAVKHLGDLIAV